MTGCAKKATLFQIRRQMKTFSGSRPCARAFCGAMSVGERGWVSNVVVRIGVLGWGGDRNQRWRAGCGNWAGLRAYKAVLAENCQ
jgi:hypothetical protein